MTIKDYIMIKGMDDNETQQGRHLHYVKGDAHINWVKWGESYGDFGTFLIACETTFFLL